MEMLKVLNMQMTTVKGWGGGGEGGGGRGEETFTIS